MNIENDWRLTNQMNYLSKKELLHIPYQPYREDWKHDHCAFCSEKINSSSTLAFCTTDKYHWICEECFADFKDLFGWIVL